MKMDDMPRPSPQRMDSPSARSSSASPGACPRTSPAAGVLQHNASGSAWVAPASAQQHAVKRGLMQASPAGAVAEAARPLPALSLRPTDLGGNSDARPGFGWKLQHSTEQAKASAAAHAQHGGLKQQPHHTGTEPLTHGPRLSLSLAAPAADGSGQHSDGEAHRTSPPLPLPAVRLTPLPPPEQQQEDQQPVRSRAFAGQPAPGEASQHRHRPPLNVPAAAEEDYDGDDYDGLQQPVRRPAARRTMNLNDSHPLLAVAAAAQGDAAAAEHVKVRHSFSLHPQLVLLCCKHVTSLTVQQMGSAAVS